MCCQRRRLYLPATIKAGALGPPSLPIPTHAPYSPPRAHSAPMRLRVVTLCGTRAGAETAEHCRRCTCFLSRCGTDGTSTSWRDSSAQTSSTATSPARTTTQVRRGSIHAYHLIVRGSPFVLSVPRKCSERCEHILPVVVLRVGSLNSTALWPRTGRLPTAPTDSVHIRYISCFTFYWSPRLAQWA